MRSDVLKILLSAILSALITWLLTFNAFQRQSLSDQKVRIDESLNKILDVNLQYPYLEDSMFIQRWNSGEVLKSDSSLRYQNYCLYIFNFSETVLEYYEYDTLKIAKNYDIEELVKPHCGWWKVPSYSEYPEKMKIILNSWCK